MYIFKLFKYLFKIVEEQYIKHNFIYTDATKTRKVGAPVITKYAIVKIDLPKRSNIYLVNAI